MVTRRTAKNKGAQFEYDVQYNFNQSGHNFYRTSERGFQMQYDLQDDDSKIVIECKFLKSITWNQAKKFFMKLKDKAPTDYSYFLVYKTNQQPVLVASQLFDTMAVTELESVLKAPFIKHPSTRST